MSLALKASRGMTRGDPGLFGFLGNVAKTVTGVASKVLPGPLGGVASVANKALGGGSTANVRPDILAWEQRTGKTHPSRMGVAKVHGGRAMPGTGVNLPFSGAQGAGIGTAFGRLSFFEGSGVAQTQHDRYRMNAAQLACPSGYKPNKSGYWLKSGQYVEPGTKCVRYRRRNPMNPKALDRAIGRIDSAKKLKDKLSRVTVRPKKCN